MLLSGLHRGDAGFGAAGVKRDIDAVIWFQSAAAVEYAAGFVGDDAVAAGEDVVRAEMSKTGADMGEACAARIEGRAQSAVQSFGERCQANTQSFGVRSCELQSLAQPEGRQRPAGTSLLQCRREAALAGGEQLSSLDQSLCWRNQPLGQHVEVLGTSFERTISESSQHPELVDALLHEYRPMRCGEFGCGRWCFY